MNLLFCFQDCLSRIVLRKKTVIVLIIVFLCSTLCGIIFVKTPTFYEFHLRQCNRYLDQVCYSQTNVIVICFRRFFGCLLYILLLTAAGIHPVALIFAPLALVYRAYTFGGSVFLLVSAYRASGVVVLLTIFLPVHILSDVLFLAVATLSFERAFRFRCCADHLRGIATDFLVAAIVGFAICLFEAFLLVALFHPIGNFI